MSRLSPLGVASLGRRSLASLTARVVGAGAGFAFQVLLARVLGAEGAGVYATALALSLIASVVGRAGMDSAVLKYGAAAYSRHDAPALAIVQRSLYTRVLPASAAIALIGIVSGPWLAASVFGDAGLARPLQWMAASVPMLSLATLYAELLRAADRQVTAALLQGAAVPLVNLALLAALAPYVTGAAAMAAIYTLATALMLLLGHAVWSRVARQAGAGAPPSAAAPEPVTSAALAGTGLRMFPAALAGILLAWVDILLLGAWAPSEQVGVYNAALRTALLSSFVLLAINSVVAPRFAATALRHDLPATAQLARRACLLSCLATLPILLLFVLFAEPVLRIFGPQFVAGSSALVIVSIGQMVNAATGPVGHLLNMRGFHGDESRLSLAAAGLNVGLCCWLIPRFGVTGAAVSNASAVAFCNVARVIAVRRRLRIWVYPGL